MRKENVFESCVGMLISYVLLLALGLVLNGWALSTVWNWYIPSIFNLPYLTLWQSVGVSMVFELFTGVKSRSNKSETSNKTYGEVFLESFLTVIITPVIIVFVAWVVYQFAF